jgi:hypothetical protein
MDAMADFKVKALASMQTTVDTLSQEVDKSAPIWKRAAARTCARRCRRPPARWCCEHVPAPGGLVAAGPCAGLAGCSKSARTRAAGRRQADVRRSPGAFTVLAGSELKDVAPALEQAATAAAYRSAPAGTLEMVERINAGEQYDAILPPNGAYPAWRWRTSRWRAKSFLLARGPGREGPVLQKLGWDKAPPTWAIARAAAQGRLRYGMIIRPVPTPA